MSRRPEEVLDWLRQKPTLAQVRQAYPSEWEVVERRVAELVARQHAEAVTSYLAAMANPAADTPGRRRPGQETVSLRVRQYMTVEAIQQAYLAAATGVTTGKIRFGLVGGYLAQRLLFAHDLERKPVSLFWFRVCWPLVRRRRSLLPLVRPRGIYCFYSRRLIKELARLVDGHGVRHRREVRGDRIGVIPSHQLGNPALDDRPLGRVDLTHLGQSRLLPEPVQNLFRTTRHAASTYPAC